MKRPVALDFFAGAGGLSLGFEQAGFDVAAAVEIDPVHAAVHKFNFPHTAVFREDIAALTGEKILSKIGRTKDEIDIIFGGPPCQGFSLIGKRDSSDTRNNLVREFGRLILEIKPKYFLMENVPGMQIGHTKKILDDFIQMMKDGGYAIVGYKILNAANFGAPQNRKRLFLIGSKSGMCPPNFPEPRTAARERNGPGRADKLPLCPSVSDAIDDLPDIDGFDELSDSDTVKFGLKPSSVYAKTLHGLLDDPTDFSYERVWDRSCLTNSLRTVHAKTTIERFSDTAQGEIEKKSRFLKLHPDGACNTLRAGTDGSRGGHTSARPIHPIYKRVISVREGARLHSYPDWFRMHSTKWHGFREVGNSVPPLLGRALASQFIKAMDINIQKPTLKMPLGNTEYLTLNQTKANDLFTRNDNCLL